MGVTNFLYNPERKGKQQLIDEFVIRQSILALIMEDLDSSPMKTPEQHYLLVGQRGSGKTTLLSRIKYAVEDSPVLKGRVFPIVFSEEQYNIGDLASLWENVAQYLEERYGYKGLYADMKRNADHADFEEKCWDILESALAGKDRRLILLIDNIGDLLKKMGEMGVRKLRRILQTSPYIRLIGASPLYLDSVLDYKQPLFEFFKVLRLENLDYPEAVALLLKLGEVYGEEDKIKRIIRDNPARIETLRILTGGVPRTIALMFNIFIDQEHENSLKDLEKILDMVTPSYKHLMDDLPPQQQKIVDAVAKNWDPINVKVLKDRIRLESKVISAQLGQLEKNQIIRKLQTHTKNHEYLIKERFFNIWYLMRYGRKDGRQKIVWLVRMLESWYTREEIEERVNDFLRQLKAGNINEQDFDSFGEAYILLMGRLTAKTKFLLHESAPERYGSKMKFNENEIEERVRTLFAEGDPENAFRWMVKLGRLTEEHKSLILQNVPGMVRGRRNLRQSLRYVFELLPGDDDSYDRIEEAQQTAIQVCVALFTGIMSYYFYKYFIEEGEFEKSVQMIKDQLYLLGVILLDTRENDYTANYGIEVNILLQEIGLLFSHGMIHSVKKIFSEGFVDEENGKVPFSELFNLIYLAINVLEDGKQAINMPAEKEGTVRQMAAYIKGSGKNSNYGI